jgi:ribosomal protein L15
LVDLQLDTVDRVTMERLGLIGNGELPVKVIGAATVSWPMVVVADKFSKGAAEEIVRAGGRIVSASDATG